MGSLAVAALLFAAYLLGAGGPHSTPTLSIVLPAAETATVADDGTSAAGAAAALAPTGAVATPPAPPSPQAIDSEWEKRSVPVAIANGRALVAVIIDDMGLDRAKGLRVIGLMPPLTLSFLPYGRDAPALAILARQRGHEVLLHMPMQPLGREDPGPQALTTDLTAIEIRTRVGAALDRFGDAIGLNNHMGSRFTAERTLMLPVMEELAARGLVFVDSRTGTASEAIPVAAERGVPAALRDVFLDNDVAPAAIAKQLEEAERVARRRGAAIAIGHPHDATLAALAQWLPGLAERGLQAVPVSAVLRRAALRGNATR
ncbi:MAG: divergent polysaccharide deacetylase family protein [Alphaproteobacteria bacterium]|nr:divergent polysaccharide deacetylase family protein [Alphaproteobacteria bacterium]